MKVPVEALDGATEMIAYYKSRLELAEHLQRTSNERIAALTTALASGMCSEHSHPDPLHCDICNMVTWLKGANTERMETIAAMEALLREVVAFKPPVLAIQLFNWQDKVLARFPHLKEP